MRNKLIDIIDSFRELDPPHDGRTWTEHLADHLLSKGVIVPPVKVGDTVYRPITTSKGKPDIWEFIVTSTSIDIDENGVSPYSYVSGHIKRTYCGAIADFREFGKTVFLTREEAEKALERREE